MPSLIPLRLDEDLRNWTENVENLEDENFQIKNRKQTLVNDLENLGKIATHSETELVCDICESSICSYKIVSCEEDDFVINGFTNLTERTDIMESDFTREISDVKRPEKWLECVNMHVIGWVKDDQYYLSKFSPIKILFPTLKSHPWNSSIWENSFFPLYKLAGRYQNEFKQMKIIKKCPICVKSFSNIEEFSHHINLDPSHANKCKDFLIPYIF